MPKPASKPIIAVDIDDVLAASAEGFINYSNNKWGTSLSPDDYDEHWAKMWQTDYEEERRRRDVVIKDNVFVSFNFYDEAKPVLKELAKRYSLVIVTSRSLDISKETKAWIRLEYGRLFDKLHFAKIWDDLDKPTTEKLRLTKEGLLTEIGADYLIDDHPKHCLAAAKIGIKVVLFGDYRWNRGTRLLPNMSRAKNWQEVMEYFDGRTG